MFGKDEAIRDPAALPQYHVDFRERLSSDPQVRWTDRIWPDGTWVANLFQFYERVYPRLVEGLKIPFQFLNPQESGLFQRHDETIVHEAVREALVNSMIHTDFRGQGGIIIERYRDRLEFSNPGTLLLGIEQVLKGGVSECRNKTLQGMFGMLGYGEKAGSGIDKIRQGWASQNWRWPMIQERHRPDRVKLVLRMVSLMPEDSLARLRSSLGETLTKLNVREVQALVTADVEGSVSNQRLQQFSADHKADITSLLQELVAKGFLLKDGYGRWASYRLSERLAGSGHNGGDSSHNGGDSSHNGVDSSHNGVDSSHNEVDSSHNRVDSSHKHEGIREEDRRKLEILSASARTKKRLSSEKTRKMILELCQVRELTANDLGELMDRNANGLRNRFLTPLVEEGLLIRRYPTEPNRPDQAYMTKEKL